MFPDANCIFWPVGTPVNTKTKLSAAYEVVLQHVAL